METTIGKYRLGRVLGSGGMGRVFAAHDTVLEREVALKRMHGTAQASPESRERFAREARAIAALRHPNVVQIYDHGLAEDGSLYTVMELLEGEDLGHRLGRVTSLTPGAFAPILVQVAAALDAAHSARIVHRDLKPENIFITSHGTESVVKILDFGVASIQGQLATKDSHLTRQNQLLGTPAYMSPEQAEGLAVDHRSDLWSLGAIAYQALTGRLPFRGENAVATLIRICTREPEPPTSLVASLPRELDRFFARALSKDPGGR
ncbi:MAG TPA: serine/threonine-protein kinase, partial [Polyangiaceae bacterium]|nr:serine/threonine-protein kinase [Polyangiaceae bacterium]